MTGFALSNASFGVNNIIVPKGGPKTIPAILDFSNTGSIDIDGELVVSQGAIEYLQGVFIDNSKNAVALTLTIHGTEQPIICPPNAQGYFAILCQNPPKMTAQTTQAALQIKVFFYNVPIQSIVWKVT